MEYNPKTIRLKNRCHISQGKSQKLEGRYSWNTERTDWNNCSSWALNSTLLSSALIFVTNPVTMRVKTSLQESMKYEVFSIVGDSLSKPEKSHDERISAGYPQNTDYFNTQYSIR